MTVSSNRDLEPPRSSPSCQLTGHVSSVSTSLSRFVVYMLPRLIPASLLLGVIPLPVGLYLGNGGAPLLSFLAPVLLTVVTGLVILSWGVLSLSIWAAGRVLKLFGARYARQAYRRELSAETAYRYRPKHSPDVSDHTTKSALLGFAFVALLIALLVPWQVAFLGAWVYHFWTCAAQSLVPPAPEEHPSGPGVAMPLMPADPRSPSPTSDASSTFEARSRSPSLRAPSPPSPSPARPRGPPPATFRQSAHLLLLLTWLLPLAAPVLAVWVRTLATAGLTAPFGGDHNVLCVAPVLVAVEWAGRGRSVLRGPARWAVLAPALAAFLAGPRRTYLVFEAASAALAWMVAAEAGPGLLGRFRRR